MDLFAILTGIFISMFFYSLGAVMGLAFGIYRQADDFRGLRKSIYSTFSKFQSNARAPLYLVRKAK